MDRFRVEVIAKTHNPQQVIYAAMHQDYTDKFVFDGRSHWPSELEAGEIIVKRLLAGERGHYGPLEHPSITFNCGYFPHSVMQQARTHRVGISFDVQCLDGDTEVTFIQASGSLRKIKIADLYDVWENGEKAIRTRQIIGRNGEPPGEYRRHGKKRIQKMSLRVLNEETGTFQIGHVNNVMCSGLQPVYRLTLADGKTLNCTINHRLLTSAGWQTMGDALGLIVDENHEVLATTQNCQLMCNGVWTNDAIYTHKNCCDDQINQGLNLRENPRLGEVAQLNQPNQNLQLAKFYQPRGEVKSLKAHPVKVTQIEYIGKQMTYDLEVDGPWHNFVANGIVVHNSYRYTGNQILELAENKKDLEDIFYLRPVGDYTDRQGKKYYYSPQQRQADLDWCLEAAKRYKADLDNGLSEEHARGKIPFDYRQHFVVSFNLRSLLHFLDLRYKKDAQLEIQKLCDLMWPHLQEWTPAIAQWYQKNRLGKSRLAP
ncbi:MULTISPECIES: FAD-dependent thymidylate synthase [Limnospira]|uniref:Thymidylate synthase, flavin-dependent n=2 Tax=Limnospira TaxID=2596745 RepID=A0A9P1KBN0_9CYAN|nr:MULTISPECIES: FAD-dependent thymidylate synthase [Limnospira]MDY7052053.1 FAD-dependent thymidylate synthase [Limnospira fusiformis LS22]MDT9186493.1 FAD-dependent thymidylate synthase [Limnospira sp. PMC 894.15]MDT9232334.1 FAD-dependent thymidylate synthase [Limnospira sp. PMC 917.15]MDT9273148.1 FAD-dependent thymidylate synthase [Limnospira sp. PMC 737.11]CDM92673.1 Thymidylate synthase, flavin-dependent [Limnospira indica PCC 8005]